MVRHRRQFPLAAIIGPLFLFVLVGFFAVVAVWFIWPRTNTANVVIEKPRPITPRGDLAEDEKSTIALFRRVAPSVVHITTLAVRRSAFNFNLQKIPQGSGSGFVWDEKGRIVTNYHVIENANEAQVAFSDHKTTLSASLVGADPSRDLAVLQINPDKIKLQKIPLGESNDLQVGQKVFAIGNPFGLDHTLTTGVVSGLGREVNTGRGQTLHNLIQTDAAINPGNSGGPLLDSAGRLIGVNSAILSPSGAFAGIGFAIPVDEVRWVVRRIINNKGSKKSPPSLGLDLISDQHARTLGINGILFYRVSPNGPAAQLDLVPTRVSRSGRILIGDIIAAVNAKRTRNQKDLMNILSKHEPGDEISITIVRGKEQRQIDIKLTLGKENTSL